jgi:hypothetical protein
VPHGLLKGAQELTRPDDPSAMLLHLGEHLGVKISGYNEESGVKRAFMVMVGSIQSLPF